MVGRSAGAAAAARSAPRILAEAPFPGAAAESLSALSRHSRHGQRQDRADGVAVMTAEALWAAAGLDQLDAGEPIFALSRSQEFLLIEAGLIDDGGDLRLPELRLP